MGKEVDLNSLDKMSIEYAEAKKRAVEGMLLYMNCLGAIFFISLSFTIGAVSLPSHL
jgi:hypothetical protein